MEMDDFVWYYWDMKTIFTSILVLSFLLSSVLLFSQNEYDRGLLLGFNISNFTGSEPGLENSSTIPGLSIGFFQEFELGSHFSFRPEIAFTTKGSRLQTVGDLFLHQVVTYMEVPLLIHWIINPGDRTRVFICGGPAADLMLLAFNEVGFSEDIRRFEMGTVLGIGLRRQKLGFRVHINQGLLDLDKSSSLTSVRNKTLSFTVGILF